MKPIVIYGIFHGDRCVYIGQTRSPRARWNGHRSLRKFDPSCKFVELKSVPATRSTRVEAAAIRLFKSRGHPLTNIATPCAPNHHGPVKVTLNVLVLAGTKTALEARRMRSGLSIGQILDATFH